MFICFIKYKITPAKHVVLLGILILSLFQKVVVVDLHIVPGLLAPNFIFPPSSFILSSVSQRVEKKREERGKQLEMEL